MLLNIDRDRNIDFLDKKMSIFCRTHIAVGHRIQGEGPAPSSSCPPLSLTMGCWLNFLYQILWAVCRSRPSTWNRPSRGLVWLGQECRLFWWECVCWDLCHFLTFPWQVQVSLSGGRWFTYPPDQRNRWKCLEGWICPWVCWQDLCCPWCGGEFCPQVG